MSPTLSTFPLETVIQILKSISDRKILSAAVRSSSHLHRAYLISREVIFSAITLRELENRGIDFWEPFVYAEYKLKYNKYSALSEFNGFREIETVLGTLRHQIKANETLKLDIPSCLLLASLETFEQYRIDDDLGASGQQVFRDLQKHFLVEGSSPRSNSSYLRVIANWTRSWPITGELIEAREEYRTRPWPLFRFAIAEELLVKKK